MMKKLYQIALLLCLSPALFAQIDTEFWFVAPAVDESHGDEPIYLRISTFDYPATVTIAQPANPSFTIITITVPANDTKSVNLTNRKSYLENQPADNILNKGLRITSSAIITAYYEVASGVNPEIFPLKGRNAVGTNFLIPSQYAYPNQVGSEAIDILATENNTKVTIVPTDTIVGHKADKSYEITLQRGETYSARAVLVATENTLAGTSISSDKPIVVTGSDDSILTGGYDLIGDQMVPTSLIGKKYIVVRGYAGPADKVYVLGTEKNILLSCFYRNY